MLAVVAAVTTCLCLRAEDPYEEIDGTRWYYTVTNDEATIIAKGGSFSGDVVFPETLGGYPVVALKESGVVTKDDITLEGAWNTYFGMVNAW